MDRADRSDALKSLRSYRSSLTAELRRVDAALKALGEAEDGARPERSATRSPASKGNSTFALLRQIALTLGAGQSLSAQEAVALLRENGWDDSTMKDPVNAANSAMFRLSKWGEWVKVSRGRYAPVTTQQNPPEEPENATGEPPDVDPWATPVAVDSDPWATPAPSFAADDEPPF